MSRVIVVVVLVAALLGCAWAGFIWRAGDYLFLSADEKIAAAFPVAPALQEPIDRLATFDDPAGVQNAQQQVQQRLQYRLVKCSGTYVPSRYDSLDEVRQHLDPACFTRLDNAMMRWLSLMEIGLILRQPPLQPLPAQPVAALQTDGVIHSVRFAAGAGIAMLHSWTSIRVFDTNTGKVLLHRPANGQQYIDALSANGRLYFYSRLSGGRWIRDVATGRLVLSVPNSWGYDLTWLDSRTAVTLRGDRVHFIDFNRGTVTRTELYGGFEQAMPVPGRPDHYVLLGTHGAIEVRLVQREYTPQVEVVREADRDTLSFFNNSDGLFGGSWSVDGATFMSVTGKGSLNLLSLQDFQSQTIDTAPLKVHKVLPTADPAKVLLLGRVKGASTVFLFDLATQHIAPVNGWRSAWSQPMLVPAAQRVGVIDRDTFRLLNDLSIGKPMALGQWRAKAG